MNNQIILGVLASGRGSDLQSIIDAIENGQIKTKIGVVLTDKPEAMALERARKAGIPAVCVDRKKCSTTCRTIKKIQCRSSCFSWIYAYFKPLFCQ